MRKRNIAVLFLVLLSTVPVCAGENGRAAAGLEIGGGSHLIVPDAYALIHFSFPSGPSGVRLSAQAGFSYLFNFWTDIHAGNIYFPLGLEILYLPMNLGCSLLYYLSLSDITGEGIFEASARTYLDLASTDHFHFNLLVSLGLSAFWDYGTRPVFPVTAKIGFLFRFPFKEKQD